eukprot:6392616-Pyramimonas_sp.AAC.1
MSGNTHRRANSRWPKTAMDNKQKINKSGVLSASLPLLAQQERPYNEVLLRVYQYLGEWNPRVWGIAEVHDPMYQTASHLKWKGALTRNE